jgi:hypothetical protein
VSISVVTVRDDEGVPSTREVYARGGRYVINSSGDLEIVSTQRTMIALYPSGNWMSVFVDDVVRIMVKGEENTSIIGGQDAGVGTVAVAHVDSDVGTDLRASADTDIDVDVGEDLDTDLEASADVDVELDAEAEASTAADADFGSDFHTEFDPTATAAAPIVQKDPEPPAWLPPGMRAVKFGPRILRPPKPKPEPTRSRHMMPVTFRARPIRAGLSKPTPESKNDDSAAGDSGSDATD